MLAKLGKTIYSGSNTKETDVHATWQVPWAGLFSFSLTADIFPAQGTSQRTEKPSPLSEKQTLTIQDSQRCH